MVIESGSSQHDQSRETCLITLLGIGDYKTCNYHHTHDPDNTVETEYVQEAIIKLMDKKFGKVIVFVTKEAKKKNWNGKNGLSSRLQALSLSTITVDIPAGKSEDEIWQIFDAVIRNIPEGSKLVVDVTHSFRSLSMVLMAALEYARVVKNIEIEAIYYGALEVLGNPKTIEGIPVAKRRVPIFDLTPFMAILDWSHAVSSFIASGNAQQLKRLADERISPILKRTRGGNKEAKAIQKFVKHLAEFCDAIATIRGPKLEKCAKQASNSLTHLKGPYGTKKHKLLPPLVHLLEVVERKLQGFSEAGDSLDLALHTAEWCIEHNLIPQGYTALQEGLITWLMEQVKPMLPNELLNYRDPNQRMAVSSALSIYRNNTPTKEWNQNAKKHKKLIRKIHKLHGVKKLAEIVQRLTTYRNNINHGGYNQNKLKSSKFADKLEDLIKQLRKWKQSYLTAGKKENK